MVVLHTCMSNDKLTVVPNLQLPDAEKSKPTKGIQALGDHALGQLNIERSFNLRAQNEDETFDDFLTDLRDLAKTSKYCDKCQESLIRDHSVIGIKDSHVIVKKT